MSLSKFLVSNQNSKIFGFSLLFYFASKISRRYFWYVTFLSKIQ